MGEVGATPYRILLHMDDGMIASTYPDLLRWEFNTLTGLFDRLGIWTNFRNLVGMLCCPFPTVGTHSEESYKLWMVG